MVDTITIQTTTNNDDLPPVEESEGGPIVEAIEAVSDNEVEIAAIEAEKEIQIAEIQAEARVTEAAIYNAPAKDEETWNRLNLLELKLAELEAKQLTQPPPLSLELEEVPAAELETLTALESDLIPPDTLQETILMETEHTEKSAEESPVIPPILEVGGKPIIRLI